MFHVMKNLKKVFRYVGEREYTNKQGQKSMKHYFIDADKDSDNRERIIRIDDFKGEKNALYVINFDFVEYRDKTSNEWKSFLKATSYTEYKK